MKAYFGDEAIKQKYLKRVERHRLADELVQGLTWEDGKGCAVGCTLENYDHKQYEIELGIPEWLARLEDTIFEGLTKEDAQGWPERFLAAIHPGADLNKIEHPFIIFVLKSNLKNFDHEKYPNIVKVTNDIIALHERDEPDDSPAWSAAESAAESATWSAARSATWSAARSVAWSAARSVAWSAAESATWSAAESAARSTAFKMFADHLVELLEACKSIGFLRRGEMNESQKKRAEELAEAYGKGNETFDDEFSRLAFIAGYSAHFEEAEVLVKALQDLHAQAESALRHLKGLVYMGHGCKLSRQGRDGFCP